MILGITGNRPKKLGIGYNLDDAGYKALFEKVRQKIKELEPKKVLTGMALGADQMAAQACIDLGIEYVACVPFAGQEKMWPQKSQDYYNALLNSACETVIVSEGNYNTKKMQIRNEYIVDNCNVLLAIWNGTPGGTEQAIRYCNSCIPQKEILVLTP